MPMKIIFSTLTLIFNVLVESIESILAFIDDTYCY